MMEDDICQPTPPLRALCLYQNSTIMIGHIPPCQMMNVVYRLQMFLCLPCAGMYMPLLPLSVTPKPFLLPSFKRGDIMCTLPSQYFSLTH